MDKTVIAENFSRNASSYDDHSVVQAGCAEKLLGYIKDRRFSRIFEIGCGTGVYTRLLSDEYGDARITAIDISRNMIEFAKKKLSDRNIHFMVADGEQVTIESSYDLITSNVSFQWFGDLDRALRLFSKTLAAGGELCFSMYGHETFKEFRDVAGQYDRQHYGLSSGKFVSKAELKFILKKIFKTFEFEEERFLVNFISLLDFLRDIKQSGTRGEGLGGNIFLGRQMIKKMEELYIKKFGKIIATHHVYFCRATV